MQSEKNYIGATYLKEHQKIKFSSQSMSKGFFTSLVQDENEYTFQPASDEVCKNNIEHPLKNSRRRTQANTKKQLFQKQIKSQSESNNKQPAQIQQTVFRRPFINCDILFEQQSEEEEKKSKNLQEKDNNRKTQQINSSKQQQQQNVFQEKQGSEKSQDTQKKLNLVTSFQLNLHEPQKMQYLIMKPIEKDYIFKLKLYRDNSKLNSFWPEFHLHFSHCSRHFMSAKKTSSKPTSAFLLSSSSSIFNEETNNHLGKIKSNFLGDVYNIFDKGPNPSLAKKTGLRPRELLATLVFQNSTLTSARPRCFSVYAKLPQFSYYKDFINVNPNEQIDLKTLYPLNKEKISIFHSRPAFWSDKLKGYLLDFHGKVACPSIKNFILQSPLTSHIDTILFGKQSENEFILELQASISPLVGFAVGLISFDSRMFSQ